MKTKQIVGVTIVAIGVGFLIYLYKGIYKPKAEVEKQFEEISKGIKKA